MYSHGCPIWQYPELGLIFFEVGWNRNILYGCIASKAWAVLIWLDDSDIFIEMQIAEYVFGMLLMVA